MKLMTVLSCLALVCVIAGCASTQKTNNRTSVGEVAPACEDAAKSDCEGMDMEDCGGCEEGKKAEEASPGAVGATPDCHGAAKADCDGAKKEDCPESAKKETVSPGAVGAKKSCCDEKK